MRSDGRRAGVCVALAVAVALQVGTARADAVVRNPSESDDDFMARVLGPSSSDLAEKPVRSTELAGGKVTLIGFVNAEDNALAGHLLVETSPGHYEHVKFPSCEEEGGAPRLLAVFFARTVKGGGRDWPCCAAGKRGTRSRTEPLTPPSFTDSRRAARRWPSSPSPS